MIMCSNIAQFLLYAPNLQVPQDEKDIMVE